MSACVDLVSLEIVKRFHILMKAQRLAHAYLFVGPKGIGKSETALGVAKLVNCEQPSGESFCDACESCVKINKGRHPDIHILDKDDPLVQPDKDKKNKTIKIEHIRELIDQTQMRPFEAKKKVFIVKDVECVTLEASNALLKTLEEPASNTLIFLTTSAVDSLLDTIKSRCQVMHFFPLSRGVLKGRFLASDGVSVSEAHFLAYFSQGCPGRIARGKHAEVIKRRNEAIDQFLFSENEDAYLKKILSDDDRATEMIRFLFYWFRDLMLLKTKMTDALFANLDRIDDLKRSSLRYSVEELEAILKEIVGVKKALEGNFNIKIALALLKEKTWKR